MCIRDRDSSEVKKGYVVKTDPAAGTMLEEGSNVTVYVSKPSEVNVPSFVGMTKDEAIQLASNTNLKLQWQEDFSSTVPEGSVISQSVNAGTPVESGTTVSLVISKGKK